MANRIRRCATRKEFEQLIDDFVTMGYKIKSQGSDNALLIKKGEKEHHGLVAVLTLWWTLGLGNLIYALIPSKNDEEVLIKIES